MNAVSMFLLLQNSAPADVGSVNSEILEYFKLIAILIGVIALAVIVLRVGVPKIAGIRAPANGPIHVLSRLTLEPRKTLYIVRAGSDYMMLATSEAGVQFLSTLDAEGVEAVLKQASANPGARSDFTSLIRLHRRSNAPT